MLRTFIIAIAGVAASAALGFEAEDQTPSGKFLTAGETRMILDATKPNWIAVREWEGQDWVYFTQVLSWRCGLHQISYAVNGGDMQVFPMPDCYADEATPNAIKENDTIYLTFELQSPCDAVPESLSEFALSGRKSIREI